jgi:hypothetical protein
MVHVGQRKLIDGSCLAKETNRWFVLGKGN